MTQHNRIVQLDIFAECQRADPPDPSREHQVYFDAIEQALDLRALAFRREVGANASVGRSSDRQWPGPPAPFRPCMP